MRAFEEYRDNGKGLPGWFKKSKANCHRFGGNEEENACYNKRQEVKRWIPTEALQVTGRKLLRNLELKRLSNV